MNGTPSRATRRVTLSCLLTVMLIGGCAPAAPEMTVEEALAVRPRLRAGALPDLPRDITDLKMELGNGGPVPGDCSARQQLRRKELETRLDRIRDSHGEFQRRFAVRSLLVAAEEALEAGRFMAALELSAEAIALSPRQQEVAKLRAFRARLHARTGAAEEAAFEMALFHAPHDWVSGTSGQIFLHAGNGAVAQARGISWLAEHHYRQAVRNRSFSTSSDDYVNEAALRGGLIEALLYQDRLTEAEAEARAAIKRLGLRPAALRAGKDIHATSYYSGMNAAPVSMLARVFLAQGRLEDAHYAATIAVNMHLVGCSEPDSLSLNKAHVALINILAQQERWPEALREIAKARDRLRAHAGMFDRLYGLSLDRAEAELRVGDPALGHALLEQYQTASEPDDEASLRQALAAGLIALADPSGSDASAGVIGLARVVPVLAAASSASLERMAASNFRGRRDRIYAGYKTLLGQLLDQGVTRVGMISVQEELLRLSSASRLGRMQRMFASLHLRSAVPDPALREQVRQIQELTEEARYLSDAIASFRGSPETAVYGSSVAALDARLSRVTLAKRTLEEDVIARHPPYRELSAPRPMSAEEIGARLRPGQTLLMYDVDEDRTYGWAVSSEGETALAVIPVGRLALTNRVTAIREALDPAPITTLADVPPFDVTAAHALFEDILAPLQAAWRDSSELVVVVGSPLSSLPFGLLATSAQVMSPSTTASPRLFEEYKAVPWLSRRVAISYLPSPNALRLHGTEHHPADMRAARRPFIGFGDPIFSPPPRQEVGDDGSRGSRLRPEPTTRQVDRASISTLPPLPDTRGEILSIARTLGADIDADVFLGTRATERSVMTAQLSHYDVLSFATHGLVPGDLNGLDQPALAMSLPEAPAADGSADGLLTLEEVLGLRLDAEVVILSACNTAAADGQTDEVLTGLARGFLYAGGRSVLVSNWAVHSAATTSLMTRMFSELARSNGTSRAEALRQAQMWMINGMADDSAAPFSYAHPLFWAPFTLVGDSGASSTTN